MGRKVFLSVLGTSAYSECHYVDPDNNYKSKKVRYIQEATIEIIGAQEWTEKDAAYIFVTEKSESLNWLRCNSRNPDINLKGLKEIFEDMNLPFQVNSVLIPEGNNDKELWDVFETIYSQIEEGDELYIDLTHGFRYLPMFMVVLSNYSKFLKNTIVESITYGNFEGRNVETEEALILNLLNFVKLQQWSMAASNFINFGSVQDICMLTQNAVNPRIKETKGMAKVETKLRRLSKALPKFIDSITYCRGEEILDGENLRDVKNIIKDLINDDIDVKPFVPIFERLQKSLSEFNVDDNVMNGFSSAKWCMENNLIQQALTILRENILTYILYMKNCDIKNKVERERLSSVLYIISKNIEESKWVNKWDNNGLSKKDLILLREMVNESLNISFANIYDRIASTRNDINHGGMVENPRNSSKLKKFTQDAICEIMSIIENYTNK